MSISRSLSSVAPARLGWDEPIVYSESDGRPMAENDQQYDCITDTKFALKYYYRTQPQVYVAADLLVYYEEGDRGKSVAPDVFVALGVAKRRRRTYLIWEEGKAPDVVFEFASPSSWRADLGWKRGLYLGLGIEEYFLFDPLGQHFDPVLQGHRLAGDRYERIAPLELERGLLGLSSEVLGLELWARQSGEPDMPFVLRLYDPRGELWLPTPEAQTAAREKAEARVAELEAKLRRLRERSAGP